MNRISDCVKIIIDLCRDQKIWVFKGEMGAGKTTLIKSIALEFGVRDRVSSPTYNLVNEYEDQEGNSYYHFDFYRIEDQEEAIDIGTLEYFESGSYCWIEWAEMIPDLIPEKYALIAISILGENMREITINQ